MNFELNKILNIQTAKSMEFHVKNQCIKKFISQFPQQNELKLLKYLTLIGIFHLSQKKEKDISFAEIKKLAKDISATCPKSKSKINEELKVIKDEIARLNEKFEEKIKQRRSENSEQSKPRNSLKEKAPIQKKPEITPKITQHESQIQPEQKNYSQKPPVTSRAATLETPKAAPKRIEKSLEPERSTPVESGMPIWLEKKLKQRYSITPKPTEIVFPLPSVDPPSTKNSKNYVTRHHLDDSQAKQLLQEEGVVYFPGPGQPKNLQKIREFRVETEPAPEIHEQDIDSQTQSSEPIQQQIRDSAFSLRPPPVIQNEHDYQYYSAQQDSARFHGLDSARADSTKAKSPQFAKTKEDIMAGLLSASKENEIARVKAFSSPKNNIPRPLPVKENRAPNRQILSPPPVQYRAPSPAELKRQDHLKLQRQEIEQRQMRERALKKKNLVSSSNSSSQNGNRSALKNVESKIKNEVNYHRELNKQLKKESAKKYPKYAGEDEELLEVSNSSRPRGDEEKFVLLERDDNADYNPKLEDSMRVRPEDYYDNQKLVESAGASEERKSSFENYGFERDTPYNLHSRRNRGGMTTGRDDLSSFKPSKIEHQGRGIQDIVDSFLNFPFMNHFSNLDKSSGYTSQDISQANTMRKESKHLPFDPKTQELNSFQRRELEEDQKGEEPEENHQRKFSDWNSVYKGEDSAKDLLKDSNNRRFSDYPKDSRVFNKEESSSLASSNFSNFLSDEMKGIIFQKLNKKGFYQKEIFDIRKSKSRLYKASGDNSSNISFNAFEFGHMVDDGNGLHSRKSTYFNTGEKSHTSFDNAANPFKQGRMSVSRLLNN